MKKFIIKIFLFIIFFLFIVWIIGLADNIVIPNNLNVKKIKSFNNFDSLDYLFVGNSYTYSGINPKYFDSLNIKIFNLGIATAGVYYYEICINDYLTLNSKPKNIMLLISPLTFSHHSDNWSAYPIHRYLNRQFSNEEVMLHYGAESYYFAMYKKSFKKGVNNLITKLRGNVNNVKFDDIIKNKGFISSDSIFSQKVFNNTKKYYIDLKKDKFAWKKFDKFLLLIKKYRNENINIIVYEIPTFKLKEFFSDTYLNDYNKAIKKIENSNIEFIKNELSIDSSYFRNIDHLNSKGSNLYSKFLVKKLNIK